MKDRILRPVFKAFEMINRCYNAEDSAASGAGTAGASDDNNTEGDSANDGDTGNSEEENEYRGSIELNPDQRPLNIFDAGKYSEEEIDQQIDLDPSVVMTEDETKAYQEKQNKPDAKKENGGGDDDGESDQKEDADNDASKNVGEDNDLKEFFDETGINQESFNSLSEKTQKYIVDKYENRNTESEEFEKLKSEFKKYKDGNESLLKDNYISLRVKELQEGNAYIPKSIPSLSNDEYEKIINADDSQEANKIIDEIVAKRVEPAVKRSWSEIERQRTLEKEQRETWGVLRSIGEIDKSFALKEKDFAKLDPNHPEWDGYNKGLGKIVKYLSEKGENYSTISRKTAKAILAAYDADTGRSAERDQRIASKTKKSILDKLRNPSKAEDNKSRKARTFQGKGHSPKGKGGVDRESLIKQVAKGDTRNYDALAEAAAGDKKKTEYYSEILTEALNRRATGKI